MLSFVTYIVLLAFVCLLCNLYGWRPEGVMRRQLDSMADTRNERSFVSNEQGWELSRFLLVLEWCIFFGLILFTRADEEYLDDLLHPDLEVWLQLAICIAVPAVWFYVQWGLYRWWAFLFHEDGRAMILTRVYKAVYMLSAPLALATFLSEIVGLLSPQDSWILLLVIFIIAQIVFIFNGIKIFWSGIGTLCFIFLYLCAFKIAPILLLIAKLG